MVRSLRSQRLMAGRLGYVAKRTRDGCGPSAPTRLRPITASTLLMRRRKCKEKTSFHRTGPGRDVWKWHLGEYPGLRPENGGGSYHADGLNARPKLCFFVFLVAFGVGGRYYRPSVALPHPWFLLLGQFVGWRELPPIKEAIPVGTRGELEVILEDMVMRTKSQRTSSSLFHGQLRWSVVVGLALICAAAPASAAVLNASATGLLDASLLNTVFATALSAECTSTGVPVTACLPLSGGVRTVVDRMTGTQWGSPLPWRGDFNNKFGLVLPDPATWGSRVPEDLHRSR